MKTILYIGDRYCSDITELKTIIDSSPAQNSLIGKELLCILKDGILANWLNDGNKEEQLLAKKLPTIEEGTSDFELLRKMGECFKSEYKAQALNILDYITLQKAEVDIDDKTAKELPLKNASIMCIGKDSADMYFKFKFKVEKAIGEKAVFDLRIRKADLCKESKIPIPHIAIHERSNLIYNQDLRNPNNIFELWFPISCTFTFDYIMKPQVELVATFMGNETVLWEGVLSNDIIQVGNISFKMIHVEGGDFDLKNIQPYSTSNIERLQNFYIAETQVTQELWEHVMKSNPAFTINKQCPVRGVNWLDCQEFIKKLNEITGLTFRLPTEAEWVFAGSGGNHSAGYIYSGSNNINEVGWYYDNSGGHPHPVKELRPNELGIYDMTGNVHEWCQNYINDIIDNCHPITGGCFQGVPFLERHLRPIRGGCFQSAHFNCTNIYRRTLYEKEKDTAVGFRLALDA